MITSDFWQICYPLVRLGGHARLAIGQHWGGCPTRVEWGNDRLVLPTVPSHVLDGVADVSGLWFRSPVSRERSGVNRARWRPGK